MIISQQNGCVIAGNSVPCVKGTCHHHHRVLDLLCVAEGVLPHSDDHSKMIDGAAWPRLASAETHRHRSQEETCTHRDDHCGFHSAKKENSISKLQV